MALKLLIACSRAQSGGAPSTNPTSDAFATLDEKVAFLERYVTFRRHYEQLEYGVFYQNNGQGCVPGPGGWNISIIARVPSRELAEWTDDAEPSAQQPPELSNLASHFDMSD